MSTASAQLTTTALGRLPAAGLLPSSLAPGDTGGAIDGIYDDGDLTGSGVRVYVVDTGVQGSHQDFGGRVVSGHTVRTHGFAANRTHILPTLPHAPQHTPHTAPAQPLTTPLHPTSPSAPLAYPSRRLAFIPSAPRVKLSTASSLLTALGAKGTAPTWPRPSAA